MSNNHRFNVGDKFKSYKFHRYIPLGTIIKIKSKRILLTERVKMMEKEFEMFIEELKNIRNSIEELNTKMECQHKGFFSRLFSNKAC